MEVWVGFERPVYLELSVPGIRAAYAARKRAGCGSSCDILLAEYKNPISKDLSHLPCLPTPSFPTICLRLSGLSWDVQPKFSTSQPRTSEGRRLTMNEGGITIARYGTLVVPICPEPVIVLSLTGSLSTVERFFASGIADHACFPLRHTRIRLLKPIAGQILLRSHQSRQVTSRKT